MFARKNQLTALRSDTVKMLQSPQGERKDGPASLRGRSVPTVFNNKRRYSASKYKQMMLDRVVNGFDRSKD